MLAKRKSLLNVKRREINSCTNIYNQNNIKSKKSLHKNKRNKHHFDNIDGAESIAHSEATPRTNNTSGSSSNPRSNVSNAHLNPIAERNRPRAVATRRAISHRNSSKSDSSTTMNISQNSSLTLEDYSDSGSVISKSEKMKSSSSTANHWYFESSNKMNHFLDATTTSNSNNSIFTERNSSLSSAYKYEKYAHLYPRSRSLSPIKGSKFTSSSSSSIATSKRRIIPGRKQSSMNLIQNDDASCGGSFSEAEESIASFATTGKIYTKKSKKKNMQKVDYACDVSVTSCRTFDDSAHRRPRAVVLREHSKKKAQGNNIISSSSQDCKQSDALFDDHNKVQSSSPSPSISKDDHQLGLSSLIQALRSQIISLHINEGKNSPDAYNTCYIMLEQLEKSHTAAISDLSDQVKHWQNNSTNSNTEIIEKEIDESTSKTINDAFFSHTPTRHVIDNDDDDDNASFYSCNRSGNFA